MYSWIPVWKHVIYIAEWDEWRQQWERHVLKRPVSSHAELIAQWRQVRDSEA